MMEETPEVSPSSPQRVKAPGVGRGSKSPGTAGLVPDNCTKCLVFSDPGGGKGEVALLKHCPSVRASPPGLGVECLCPAQELTPTEASVGLQGASPGMGRVCICPGASKARAGGLRAGAAAQTAGAQGARGKD